MEKEPMGNTGKNEEEYNFIDDQGSHHYQANTTKNKEAIVTNGGASSGRKKVFILIGIVVALFFLYKLYETFSSTKSTPAPMPVTAAKPMVEVQPKKEISNLSVDNSKAIADLANRVYALEQTITSANQKSDDLQQQIIGLSTAIGEIQNNIAQLTQQVGALAQQKTAPVKKASVVKLVKKHPVVKVMPPTIYYVNAMIQGRAWLSGSDGSTLTVSNGDELSGYGRIEKIDPDNGTVTTSSGRTINDMPQINR